MQHILPCLKFLATRVLPGLVTALLISLPFQSVQAADRPNIIIVITDDQGYGDIGAHGNPMIQTPHLDQLHKKSSRLTDYHVDPTCSPTRSALLTGRYSTKTGVWHTIMGRSMMATDEKTIAEVLRENGYQTAMFGKWHLGDNAPTRPQDQGFDHAIYHGGGGVWQTPDFYGNDYFDDTYFENGTPRKFSGYCTDVWFSEAIHHIDRIHESDNPFFFYISTNAPHSPFWVDEKYSKPYKEKGLPSPMAEFYGMITNIDENVGKLRSHLDKLKLSDDTLFIFTTDNGTAAGIRRGNIPENAWAGVNAGMRGQKGSEYDGGHRVPFFAHWPNGGIATGRDVPQLTAHIDIMPTLLAAAGIKKFKTPHKIDGFSILSLLQGEIHSPSRTLFVHSQRIDHPEKWRKSAVMTTNYRLVNGKELYHIKNDPGQTSDIASENPELVSQLREKYEKWWKSIDARFDEYVRIDIGSNSENPALITAHDWHPFKGTGVPWNQNHIANQPAQNGYWEINVTEAGTYEFILRSKPAIARYILPASKASIKVGDQELKSDVPAGANGVRFVMKLEKGPTQLSTKLIDPDGTTRGAFFIEATKL